MKPLNHTLPYADAALTALAVATSAALLAAAYLLTSYAFESPVQIVVPGW